MLICSQTCTRQPIMPALARSRLAPKTKPKWPQFPQLPGSTLESLHDDSTSNSSVRSQVPPRWPSLHPVSAHVQPVSHANRANENAPANNPAAHAPRLASPASSATSRARSAPDLVVCTGRRFQDQRSDSIFLLLMDGIIPSRRPSWPVAVLRAALPHRGRILA